MSAPTPNAKHATACAKSAAMALEEEDGSFALSLLAASAREALLMVARDEGPEAAGEWLLLFLGDLLGLPETQESGPLAAAWN